MAEIYSFFNSKEHDRVYNARHWADYFFPLFKSGVFNGDLQVIANGGMSVKIKSGYAWIDGYGYHLTDELVMDLETASGNMNRADSIVIRLDLTNRWIKAFVGTGNYYAETAVPKEPQIKATMHEIVLAHINVAAGTTEITQDMIQDTRMDKELCGWVCGAVEQIDFEQITAQFKAFMEKYENYLNSKFEKLEEYETEKKTQFDTFQAELYAEENELHKQHEKNLADYFSQLKAKGDADLATLTQQLIDFRNTNESKFLEWFEKIKGVFSTDAAAALLLEIDRLNEQVEDMEGMLLSGKIMARLITDDGKYLTDDMGNPLLADRPICACNS